MSESAGRVESIWRYPIKSFQGESIAATQLEANGIFADRALALVERETGKVLSGKHKTLGERVLEFTARYESEPVSDSALPAVIATIDGREHWASDRSALAAACVQALGVEVDLVAAGGPAAIETYWPEVADVALSDVSIEFPLPLAEAGSFADLEPLHILTTGSLAHLGELAASSQIAPARFRPSLIVDTGTAKGFVENDWVERKARLGDAELEFGGVSPRCIMTTRPQLGLPRDIDVLRTIARENRLEFMGMQMACLGVYAKVTRPGRVAVGDRLELL